MTTKLDIVPENDNQLVLGRIIDAPVEQVYRGWTDPVLMKKWFAPRPWSTPRVVMDVRPGGGTLVVMADENGTESVSVHPVGGANSATMAASVIPARIAKGKFQGGITTPAPRGMYDVHTDNAKRHLRLADGRGESKRGEAELDVVVDRLGDADDGDFEPAASHLFGDCMRPSLRAVAADAEENVNSAFDKKVDRHARLLRASRRAEHRAAVMMNVLDAFGSEIDRRPTNLRV